MIVVMVREVMVSRRKRRRWVGVREGLGLGCVVLLV